MSAQPTEILSPADEAKLLKEAFNIEIDKLEHYMELLSQWLSSQKHLPQNCSKNFLRKFLIWSKLDFEKAKTKFETFWYSRLSCKEFFFDRVITSDKDLKCLKYTYGVMMPKLTPNGCRVNIVTIFDPKPYDILEFCRTTMMSFDYKFHVDGVVADGVVAGEIAVCDCDKIQPQHYPKLFNASSLKFVKLGATNFPVRIKHIFIVNCHPTIRIGFNIIKSLVPEKISSRLVILENPRELLTYIPPECLPSNYGGTAESLEVIVGVFVRHFRENEKFYVDIGNMRPTGPLPEKYKMNYANEFGLDGSFRKLNID
ncbi:CRAL/TRIO domain [Popillia japonica]|uniref:CRAL/TRIO domain n=1 Tax=Popillia japonica TaxID=7064 RepID=A0AAW1MK91_POPJA